MSEAEGDQAVAGETSEPAGDGHLPEPVIARWQVAAEVAAVVLLTFLPAWFVSLADLLWPRPSAAGYWEQSLGGFVQWLVSTPIVLLVMARSGEGWAAFGLVRPRVWFDPGYALLLLAVTAPLLIALPVGEFLPAPPGPAVPGGALPIVLATVDHLLFAFHEELVARAFLIVRLGRLLGSRAASVVVAALLFASWHFHGGVALFIHALVFGLVLGAVFVGLRRLWPLVLTHLFWNLMWGVV